MEEPSRNAYQAIHFAVDARYRLVKRLGQGTYGTVCSAQDLKSEDQHLIAVKKVNNIFNREVLVRRALRELRLMRCLRGHRNIVSLIDLDYVTKAPYDGLYCYQELMDFDLINVIRGPIELTNLHLQSFMYQLLCGVKYIHSGKVIHRDLKPGNLLVSRDGVVKICDFGLARGMNYDLNDKTQITAYVATRWYRAPELIMSYRNYTEAIDIWAVGCIFGELLGRHPLFQGQNPMDQLKKICKVVGIPSKPVLERMGIKKTWEVLESNMPQYTGIPYSKLFPDADFAALDLIGKLLRFDPTKRVSAVGALRHKYLANFQNSSSEAIMTSPVDFNFESLSFENLKAELEEEVRGFRREVRGIPPGGPIHPHRLYHQDYIHTR